MPAIDRAGVATPPTPCARTQPAVDHRANIGDVFASAYDLAALVEWESKGTNGEQRARAAEMIRDALAHNKTELTLSCIRMDETPPLPQTLLKLYAWDCGIKEPPKAWPPRLQLLNFAHNDLTSSPDLPPTLHYGSLAHNRLTKLPGNAMELPNLVIKRQGPQGLNLAGNSLDAEAREAIARFNREAPLGGPRIYFPE